jgi:uncharacterized protein (DUF433 family)
MLDRITIDPRVCEGKPTVRGLRFTVDFVLRLLADGYTAEEIVATLEGSRSRFSKKRLGV